MTAQKLEINLLPKDPFEDSFGGRLLKWALSVGRYIVIATELVVIGAFLSRFKLDRDLADLNEAIAQKQAVLQSYQEIETAWRETASRLGLIKKLTGESLKVNTELTNLAAITPQDLVFTVISINPEEMELSGRALSEAGLAALINQLKSDQRWGSIVVDQIISSGERGPGLIFHVRAQPKAG